MTDPDAMFEAVVAAPDDDTARLVYADSLDERGRPGDAALAEFIRAQVTLAAHGTGMSVSCLERDTGRTLHFSRWGLTAVFATPGIPATIKREELLLRANWEAWTRLPRHPCPVCWAADGPRRAGIHYCSAKVNTVARHRPQFRRGFLDAVHLESDDVWATHTRACRHCMGVGDVLSVGGLTIRCPICMGTRNETVYSPTRRAKEIAKQMRLLREFHLPDRRPHCWVSGAWGWVRPHDEVTPPGNAACVPLPIVELLQEANIRNMYNSQDEANTALARAVVRWLRAAPLWEGLR